MKIRTRITAAVALVLASLFVSAPAFAHGDVEKYDPSDAFSHAGEPLQVYAILILGAILLIIVLGLAHLVGKAFDK